MQACGFLLPLLEPDRKRHKKTAGAIRRFFVWAMGRSPLTVSLRYFFLISRVWISRRMAPTGLQQQGRHSPWETKASGTLG